MNSKEENSSDFWHKYVQEFGLRSAFNSLTHSFMISKEFYMDFHASLPVLYSICYTYPFVDQWVVFKAMLPLDEM